MVDTTSHDVPLDWFFVWDVIWEKNVSCHGKFENVYAKGSRSRVWLLNAHGIISFLLWLQLQYV